MQATVGDGGVTSSMASIRSGVPQGSVLGPLLFLLYLSDFGRVLRHCSYNFYADDLQIYLQCEPTSLPEAIDRINEDIRAISVWTHINRLTLNAKKTQAIILGTSRFVNVLDLTSVPRIIVEQTHIDYSKYIKYLGVTISNNLSWDRQVMSTVNKIRSIL